MAPIPALAKRKGGGGGGGGAAMAAFSIVTGIIGVIGFALDRLPDKKEGNTVVRMGVGLSGSSGLSDSGGDCLAIVAHNYNKQKIGWGGCGKIPDGGFADAIVDQLWGRTQQAWYLDMGAGNNGICLAYVTTTWADGQQFGFVGNWFETCGGTNWYNSNIYMDGYDEPLKCGWLDKKPPKGVDHGVALRLEIPEFKPTDDWDLDPNRSIEEQTKEKVEWLCNHNRYRVYKRDGSYNQKRDEVLDTVYREITDTRFVISNGTKNAIELCSSATSFGPDQMDEANFCDMETKTLWPLCTAAITTDCFDVDIRDVRTNKVRKRETPPYTHTLDWRKF